YLARSFELLATPAVEERLLRLAASTNEWAAAIDGYTRALRTCGDTERIVQLLLEQGRVFEVQLEDWQSAVGAYKRAVELAPDNTEAACAVVRSAGRLTAWDAAAWGLLENAHALSALA